MYYDILWENSTLLGHIEPRKTIYSFMDILHFLVTIKQPLLYIILAANNRAIFISSVDDGLLPPMFLGFLVLVKIEWPRFYKWHESKKCWIDKNICGIFLRFLFIFLIAVLHYKKMQEWKILTCFRHNEVVWSTNKKMSEISAFRIVT